MKRIVDKKRVKNRKRKKKSISTISSNFDNSNFNDFENFYEYKNENIKATSKFENSKKIDSSYVQKRALPRAKSKSGFSSIFNKPVRKRKNKSRQPSRNLNLKNNIPSTSRALVPTKKKKKYINFVLIFRIISLIILIICLANLFKWNKENNSNKELLSDIKSQVSLSKDSETNFSNSEEVIEKDYSLDFAKLKELNPDTVGWIKVNNTDVDFPFVQGKNNDYYMTHNFNKEYNSAGWIFADYRNIFDGTDKNTIIYGHNRRDGSMFSTLNNTLDELWYSSSDNHIITLHTPEKNLQYQVFSVYKVNSVDFDNATNFKLAKDYQNYITTALNRSIYNFNVKVTTIDKILTLYTCANNNQYRIIVHGKLITE